MSAAGTGQEADGTEPPRAVETQRRTAWKDWPASRAGWVLWGVLLVTLGWLQTIHWEDRFEISGKNLVRNGYFNAGHPGKESVEGWDVIAPEGVSVRDEAGVGIAELRTVGSKADAMLLGGAAVGRSVYLSQRVGLPDGATHLRVSVDMKGVGLISRNRAETAVAANLAFLDRAGRTLPVIGVPLGWMSEAQRWHRYEAVYTVPEGAASAVIRFENTAKSGQLWIKDVQLVDAVEEPQYAAVGGSLGAGWVILLGAGLRRMLRIRSLARSYAVAALAVAAFWCSCYPGIRQEYRPLLWGHFPGTAARQEAGPGEETAVKSATPAGSGDGAAHGSAGESECGNFALPPALAGRYPISVAFYDPRGFAGGSVLDWLNYRLPGIDSSTWGLHFLAFFSVGLLSCLLGGTWRACLVIAVIGIASEVFQYFKLAGGDLGDIKEALQNVAGAVCAGIVWWVTVNAIAFAGRVVSRKFSRKNPPEDKKGLAEDSQAC